MPPTKRTGFCEHIPPPKIERNFVYLLISLLTAGAFL